MSARRLAEIRLEDVADPTPIGETTGKDPSGAYERLRAEWGTVAPVLLEPGLPAWLVTGYPEVLEVLHDEDTFSRDPRNWTAYAKGQVPASTGIYPMVMARNDAYKTDGDERRRLRTPISDAIAAYDEHRLARQLRTICRDLVDRIRLRGEGDLVEDYAAVVPLLAIADMCGLDGTDGPGLLAATRKIYDDTGQAARAFPELEAIFARYVESRRSWPEDDLTTFLLQHPSLSGDDEVQAAMTLMVAAGYEMTVALLVQTLLLMLDDGRFGRRLRAGRLDVGEAIEESLWRQPPAYNLPPRYVMTDVELGGRIVRKGDAVVPSVAGTAAEQVLTGQDPWLEIGNRSHVSWGAGVHACPAQRPAWIIIRTAVQVVLDGLPGLRLAAEPDDLPRVHGRPWSRYPVSLPVTFGT